GGEAGGGVAIDESRVRRGERRQRRAIELGLIVGGDGQHRRGDGETAGRVADAVIAVGRAAGGNDVRIARDVAAGRCRGTQRRLRGEAGRGVPVDQADIAGRQCRQHSAVDLGFVNGGDGQRRRSDGEGPRHVADRVVAVGRTAGGDWVGARRDWAVSGGGGAQHRLEGQTCAGVTVDEAGVRRGQRRQHGTVNLGVVEGGDRQRHRGDG